MFSFFGLGKKRSKFGKWLDKRGIKQIEIEERSGLSRGTVSKLCNDDNYRPKFETILRVEKALRSLGFDVDRNKFWGA
jgi:transcriptional regulator with XRE-family HTH domain